MAASVWMTSWMGRPVLPELISRPVPLITPLGKKGGEGGGDGNSVSHHPSTCHRSLRGGAAR
jgi:hypothetical protein